MLPLLVGCVWISDADQARRLARENGDPGKDSGVVDSGDTGDTEETGDSGDSGPDCQDQAPLGVTIPAWNATWPDGPIDGVDGWESGYAADTWFGGDDGSTRWLLSLTDDYDRTGAWLSGGPLDDWLVHAAVPVTDGGLRATFWSEDDDTIGLAIGVGGEGPVYLFLLCGAVDAVGATCPLDLGLAYGSALVRVEVGVATVLASSDVSYTMGDIGSITLSVDDGVLVGEWAEAGLRLEAADAGATGVGLAGPYAYNAGYSTEDPNMVAFADLVWFQFDDDDDGVPDDDDACPLDPGRS